jgi:trehalose-6-phosphatase
MIIRFEIVQVLEYYTEEVDGRYFEEKKFSKITIKLTKCPTEDDKK